MKFNNALNYKKRRVIAGILVTLILLFIFSLILYERNLLYKDAIARELTNAANEAKERLEANLDEAEVAVATLSYIVKKYGVKNDFDEVAKKILETSPTLDELALIEGEIITHVYPLKGNEKAIGHNIFKDSNQNKQVFKTLEKKRLTFAGPFILAQGGTGIIARQPIYIDGKYFGFATAILNPSKAFQKAIIREEYSYQVSKRDTLTAPEEFFLSPSETFDLSSAASVTLDKVGWKIYVCHSKPQSFSRITFFSMALFGLLLSLLGGFLVWHIMSLPERLKHLVDERTNLLKASEEKYHTLFEKASDAISIINNKGNILDVNSSMCQMLDYTREELLQMNIEDLITNQQLKQSPVRYDLLAKGKNVIIERKVKTKTGSVIDFEINAQNIGDGITMGIGRNVTEIRKAEQQIALNEKILRGAFDYSSLGMAIVSLKGKFIRVNRQLCQILGYTESELLSLSFQQITHPDDLDMNIDHMIKARQKELDVYRTEKRYFQKNGSVIWVNLNTSAVKDDSGQPIYFVTQIEDITEKKKMIELLKEKEYQLRIFIEHSPAALAMFDKDMNYIMISNQYRTDYNLGQIEIIGKNHYDIFTTIPDRWKKIHRQCLAGSVQKCEEDSFIREDGSIDWLKWEIHPWRKDSGEIGGIILFSEMITELKESQLKFQNLVETSLVGVAIIQNEKLQYINPGFAEIFGYSAEELINMKSVTSIFYDDDIKIIRKHIRERMEGLKTPVHYEARGVKKTGEIIWLDIQGTVTLYKGTKAIVGSVQDITESKKSQAIILHEKILSDTIINVLPGFFYIIHPDGRMVRWNKNLETVTGYCSEEIGKMKSNDFVNPEQLSSIIGKRQNIFTTGKASAEVEIITKQKQKLTYYITIMPIVYNGENCILGLGIDFTEKKATELALVKKNLELKESEEKFRKLVEEAQVGVFILQDGVFKYFNPQIEQMSGYSKDELMDAPFDVIIHKDDVEEMQQKYFARITGQSSENHYFMRGVKKDGSVRYIEIIASVINYRLSPAIIGTAIDITEQTEEENRITRAVTDAQENERQQISMELHDNVKQIMAASLLNLEFIKMKMVSDEAMVPIINNVKSYIRDAIEELRKLSHKLAPSIDLNIPLEEKIKALVDAMNISEKLQVSYCFEKFDKPIPQDAQLVIYRILQEQFSNILKYAKASEVNINLTRKKSNIVVSVSDNGAGFNTTIRKFGIGLENIKRRMQILKGKMEVLSEPGKGCTLTVLIPDE